MSLTAHIETDPNCFTTLTAEWLELLEHSLTNTVFQTPQFLHTWWLTLGSGTLQVIVMRDETQALRGIAPLFLQTNSAGLQELCFVGCVNVSDYLDVIVHKDFEKPVYELLYETITQKIAWQELYWCSLPESSHTRDFLKTHFPQAVESVQDVTPQIALPAVWEDYLAHLDRKQRHEVKRKWRRLDELTHEFELITDEDSATAAVDEFIELHKASSAEKKSFWNEQHLVFFKKLIPDTAQMGWLKLFFLQIEGKRVATMLAFDYNNKYDLYNSGFYPELYKEVGTGTVLTAYTIQHAIENKKAIYDFLRGGELYKFRLGAVAKNVYDISVK
jgi:CelD/BcsL family acetyltransferase involved in cellulose biosynthesis